MISKKMYLNKDISTTTKYTNNQAKKVVKSDKINL